MATRAIRILLIGCLCLGTALHALPVLAQSGPLDGYNDRAGGAENHISVILHADRAPMPGEVATLTLSATPELDAGELLMEWIVPEGVELLGGSASESSGAVAANQSVSQQRQLRFAAPGVYKIMAQASYSLGSSMHFSALGVLFFTIDASGASTASDRLPDAKSAMGTKVETEVTPVATTAAITSPNDDPCFTVNGHITRWDYPPTTNPSYAPRVEVPLRYVVIALREEDLLFDDTYGEGTTDGNGNFSFSFCDDDGVFDDELELYIEIQAEIDFGSNDVVSVEDDGIIDDQYEFESEVQSSEGGTLNFNLRMKDGPLDEDTPENQQSAIMNIADAVFDAWNIWNISGGAQDDDDVFDGEAEVHFEAGDGIENSFYNGYFLFGGNVFNSDDISIADDASDPDPWDDSVIIHEWGHMADDYYGCDDNGGGDHFVDQLADDLELSWGEGYPDYWQSAVRSLTGQMNPSWYIDVNGTGMGGIAVDLETYDATRAANLLSEFNEFAIAAMLWDLNDNANDPRTVGPPAVGPFDSVSHGHATIQEVYTDPFFESNGDWVDDTCTSFVYLWSWLKLGKPSDAATAEAVTKNNGRSNPFFGGALAASAVAPSADGATPQSGNAILAPTLNDNPSQVDYRWWKRLTLVVDNSASMEESGKLDAVKTVMKETVNDAVNNTPKGLEVQLQTFNNGSPVNQVAFQSQFRTESIYPLIDQVTPSAAADFGCPTSINALGSLQQAIQDQSRGQVWLYTDADTYWQPGLPLIKNKLNQQQMRASFALLGGCSTSAQRMSDVSGAEEDYLQLAADGSQTSGIVPYLLTALASGGQFLYVNSNQLGDAADILRAQLSNSAGAGKWSDYVSDEFTYRWDRLEPSEYLWITGLSDQDQLSDSGSKRINLPNTFNAWGHDTTAVDVYQDGYIRLNACDGEFCIPVYDYANILRKDLVWYYNPPGPKLAATASAPTPEGVDDTEYGWWVHVYTGIYHEWFVISTEGTGEYGPGDWSRRAYQVWLNSQTGEIRYLYDQIRDQDSGTARISMLQESPFVIDGTREVVVSNEDLAGARNGNGYKFTPAPPMPTRTYAVKADALIERIGFLLTGYSGAFEQMVVTDPNDAAVTCGEGGVTCTIVDHNPGDRMVQYIEVPVNGVAGTWHATVDASSNQATFSFNALAASDLNADSPSSRLRPSIGAAPLSVQLGRATDDNLLTAWLQQPNGNRFSGDFTLYDDGAHGDGRAGDGRFGLPDYNAPGRGIGYLWVKGTTGGVEFERADPVPFNFEPFKVMALTPRLSNNNEPVDIAFQVDNLDVEHDVCVDAEVTLPFDWSAEWNFDELGCQLISAGASQTWILSVVPGWESAPSGQEAQVAVAFMESGEGAVHGSDSVTFVRRRPPAAIFFDERAAHIDIRPDPESPIPITIRAVDAQGYPVEDGALIEVIVDNGTVAPAPTTSASAAAVSDQATIEMIGGRAEVYFYPPATEGDVNATTTLGALSDTMTLHVRQAAAHTFDLTATPTELFDGPTTAELTVTVKDAWGDPVADALVRVGVSDDAGTQGTIDGAEVITGTTDANGQLQATFTKSDGAIDFVWVAAQLLLEEEGVMDVKQEDLVQIYFEEPPPPNPVFDNALNLPFVSR